VVEKHKINIPSSAYRQSEMRFQHFQMLLSVRCSFTTALSVVFKVRDCWTAIGNATIGRGGTIPEGIWGILNELVCLLIQIIFLIGVGWALTVLDNEGANINPIGLR
jgi:hypothetical protein